MVEGVNVLEFFGVVRRSFSIEIAGRAGGFVSIVTNRSTPEVIAPFPCSVKCRIPHLSMAESQIIKPVDLCVQSRCCNPIST